MESFTGAIMVANTYFIKLNMNPGSKLFLYVCRSQGFVYTYRLHRDDAGSWAAEVRHFI